MKVLVLSSRRRPASKIKEFERLAKLATNPNTDVGKKATRRYAVKSMNEDWQKVNRKDKTDGMSQKAVNAYRREPR